MRARLRRWTIEQPVRCLTAVILLTTILTTTAPPITHLVLAIAYALMGRLVARRCVSMDKLTRISPTIAGKIADGTFKRV